MKSFWFVLLLTAGAFAQTSGNVTMTLYPGVPFGTCNSRQLALNQSNGQLYSCNGITWQAITGGGGGGWNPPNAPGDTIFGNNTVSTGAPSFFIPGGDVSFSGGNFSVNRLHFGPNTLDLTNTGIANGNCLTISGTTLIGGACGTGGGGGNATGLTFNGTTIPLGSPAPTSGQYLTFNGTSIVGGTPSGGGGLTGCSTPTSGNLVCDNSVTGGTGPVGLLTLPYASTGLPTPPSTALAAIAANASGQLFSTTGHSAAWVAIGSGGGGATGTATALQFGSTTMTLSSTVPGTGECLTVSASEIAGGACGTGGALGGVNIVP